MKGFLIFLFLCFWSWLTIKVYQSYLRQKELDEAKERYRILSEVKYEEIKLDIINVDPKIAKKVWDDFDKENPKYFDFYLEFYNDNKNCKVLVENKWMLGDLKPEDVDPTFPRSISVWVDRKVNNNGEFEYKATASIKKRVDR